MVPMATATSSLICIMYLYNSVPGSVRKERIDLSKIYLIQIMTVATTVTAHHAKGPSI